MAASALCARPGVRASPPTTAMASYFRTSRQRSRRLRQRAPNSTGDSQMETMLKKPETFRDSMGRFDRPGKTLAKTQKKTGLINKKPNPEIQTFLPQRHPDGRLKNGGPRPGAGRPKGSQNKIPLTLKQMLLNALEKA